MILKFAKCEMRSKYSISKSKILQKFYQNILFQNISKSKTETKKSKFQDYPKKVLENIVKMIYTKYQCHPKGRSMLN